MAIWEQYRNATVPIRVYWNKIQHRNMAKIALREFVFLFVIYIYIYMSKGLYIYTRNLGHYAPKFLALAEGWWPSATDWQG